MVTNHCRKHNATKTMRFLPYHKRVECLLRTHKYLFALSIISRHATWWRHKMETFSVWLSLGEGNPLVTGGFPSQRPVTRSLDIFFDLRPNKRLSKQSRRRWFETQSRSLWRHCNGKHSSVRAAIVEGWRPCQYHFCWWAGDQIYPDLTNPEVAFY